MSHTFRQVALKVHRLVCLLTVFSLMLPAGSVFANATTSTLAEPFSQSETPTETPTMGPTPTETFNATASTTDTPTATPTETATPVPTESAEATETPTEAVPTTPDAETTPLEGGLQFTLIGPLDAVKQGDDVAFTVTIANTGQVALTDLTFTSTLSDLFTIKEKDLGDFAFEPETRLLTWQVDSIGPGQTITSAYTLTLTDQANSIQPYFIIETAWLTAAELAEPVKAGASVLVTHPGQKLNPIDERGGQAVGLGDTVRVNVPPGAVKQAQAISITDLSETYPANGTPWRVFEVSLLSNDALTPPEPFPVVDAGSESAEVRESAPEQDTVVEAQPVEAAFEQPVELAISFDGLTDLGTLDAAYEPYVVTLDEASGIWVNVPLESVDRATNTVTVETTHFSTWGAGVGPAFPQNGAGVLLFDSASPDLFAGNSHFSIPIWTPPGRNGMGPSLALSYSSGAVNGVLGDIQAPWVGMGWSIGSPEIARKITTKPCTQCGSTGGIFGYKNEFVLLLNGTGYELIPDGTTPGRYHTREESFLYIQRHNAEVNPPESSENISGEWWEVVERNGTRWVLGKTESSEQMTVMAGYPGNDTGAWSSLGYAGKATNMVALRWRADSVTDVYGNYMTFIYVEEERSNVTIEAETTGEVWVPDDYWWGNATFGPGRGTCLDQYGNPTASPPVGYPGYWVGQECIPSTWGGYDGTVTSCEGGPPCANGLRYNMTPAHSEIRTTTQTYTITYERASYLAQVDYTLSTQSGGPPSAYSVVFDVVDRTDELEPTQIYDWDTWDRKILNAIYVRHGDTSIRTYDLNYEIVTSPTDDGKTWKTTVLQEVIISGTVTGATITYAPKVSFSYVGKDNRANCGSGCQEWQYPRLVTVNNGWEGEATFTYNNDGRGANSWYNWRVNTLTVGDGVSANLLKTDFSYSNACYKNPDTATWSCTSGDQTELVGYGQTTVTTKDFDGTTVLGIAVHKFHTDQQKQGREYEVEYKQPDGTVLAKTTTTYTVVTSGLPANGFFTFASAVESFTRQDGALKRITRSEYGYDSTTGNLQWAKDYDGVPGTATLYRQTEYTYQTNTNPGVWILDRLWKQIVKDASGIILSEQQYGYDGNLPGTGALTKGALTLTKTVQPNGTTSSGTTTLDSTFAYDAYGNLTESSTYLDTFTTTTAPTGTNYQSVTATYDPTGTYPISSTLMAPGLPSRTTTTEYYPDSGLVQYTIDANGAKTSMAYDGLGRVVGLTYPGYEQPAYNPAGYAGFNVQYSYPTVSAGGTVTAPFGLEMRVWDELASTPQYRSAWAIYDGLGRTLQIQGPDQNGSNLIVADTEYNALGLVKRASLPRLVTGAGGQYQTPSWAANTFTSNAYDALGRLLTTTFPDGSITTTNYNGLRTTFVDRNLHQKVQEVNAFGQLVKVEEYTGTSPSFTLYAATVYQYNTRGLLTRVTDAVGNLTTVTYNALGQKTAMNDPDMGSWTYAYDPLGNLQTQTDARGCVTTLTYDSLNRLTGKTYSGPGGCDPTPDVTYTYDTGPNGLGHRTSMTDGSGSTAWEYNLLGQMVKTTQTITGAPSPYTTEYTFDAFGRPRTQKYPGSNELLTFYYNAMGLLNRVDTDKAGQADYVSGITYNEAGQVQNEALGNGVTQEFCYQSTTLRLTAIRAYGGSAVGCGANPSNVKLNLSYQYDSGGNVTQLGDATRSETTTYTYDALDRLTNVLATSGTTTVFQKAWTYDPTGNMTSFSQAGTSAIEGGTYHTCAVTANGGVKCWGRNNSGQIGDGTFTNRTTPINVSGLISGITAIATGGDHSCALTTDGAVKCWGKNAQGQLGDGTTTTRTTPTNVIGLSSGVVAITAGHDFTCALTSSGGVKCWGGNGNGQLGDGTVTNRTSPVNVSGLASGVTVISAGQQHICALLAGGSVKCWGLNHLGQIGDDSATTRKTPVAVYGLSSGIAAITTGAHHSCAVTTAGAVKCWGNNANGQLGDGTTTNRAIPVSVSGLSSGVAAITAGLGHVCALTTAGAVKCWGQNSSGQIGDSTTTNRLTPVSVAGLASGVTLIAGGGLHNCALLTTAQVKCWGGNGYGAIGDGTTTNRPTPVSVNIPPSTTTYTYPPPGSPRPHAVTSLSSGETFAYDVNGNMTSRVEGGVTYQQNFDAENRLTSIIPTSGVAASFKYDGDGNLVAKLVGNVTTYYIGGLYEVEVTNTTVSKQTYYYPAGGAIRVIDGGGDNVFYVLKDHLGSASVTLDAGGSPVAEMRFYPFGEVRVNTGATPTDKRFQSQRDVGLGLMQFGARFYHPRLGRFISADTIVPNFANPQALNRYAFVLNNPLKYIDPTGHTVICGAACEDGTAVPTSTGSVVTYANTIWQCTACNSTTDPTNDDGALEPIESAFISGGGGSSGGGCGLCGAGGTGGDETTGEILAETIGDDWEHGFQPAEGCSGQNGHLRGTTCFGMMLDIAAFGLNSAYAMFANSIVMVTGFNLAVYGFFEAVYQIWSIVPNTISTISALVWFVDGILSGENTVSFWPGSISISVGQDTIVASTLAGTGWAVRDYNLAVAESAISVAYNAGRVWQQPTEADTLIPTIMNPTIIYNYDPIIVSEYTDSLSFSWTKP